MAIGSWLLALGCWLTTGRLLPFVPSLYHPTAQRRRRIFGGLLGGAAVLGGGSLLEAKKGKGKGKTKVWLCHQPDPVTGIGTVIQVGSPARKGHTKHGDVECPALADTTQQYVNGGSCTVTAGVATCDVTPTTS